MLNLFYFGVHSHECMAPGSPDNSLFLHPCTRSAAGSPLCPACAAVVRLDVPFLQTLLVLWRRERLHIILAFGSVLFQEVTMDPTQWTGTSFKCPRVRAELQFKRPHQTSWIQYCLLQILTLLTCDHQHARLPFRKRNDTCTFLDRRS